MQVWFRQLAATFEKLYADIAARIEAGVKAEAAPHQCVRAIHLSQDQLTLGLAPKIGLGAIAIGCLMLGRAASEWRLRRQRRWRLQ